MPTTPDALKLAAEYRQSMTAEVLHAWAADARSVLEQQRAALESLRSKVTAYEVHCAAVEAEVESLRAGRAVPGWKLVPVEPTPVMKMACQKADMDHGPHQFWLEDEWPDFLRAWQAMLSAAPTPPQSEQAGKGEIIAWVRECSDGTLEGPILDNDSRMCDTRRKFWTRLSSHPSPPPDDARDAKRYRLIRRGQHWSVVNGIGDTLRGDELDAALSAHEQKAGE